MARSTFPASLRETLAHEGGYREHAGGRMNFGVTQTAYEAWVRHPVTEKFMRSLTPDHVRALYKVNFWDAVRGDDLPVGVDLCVFDRAVCDTPHGAAAALQRIVGVEADGVVGAETLEGVREYIRKHGQPRLVDAYQDSRYGTDRARVDAVRGAAKAMARVGVAA
jgi:lysozyme family protein